MKHFARERLESSGVSAVRCAMGGLNVIGLVFMVLGIWVSPLGFLASSSGQVIEVVAQIFPVFVFARLVV